MVSAAEIIKQHRFVMLSKSWCPDCHYAIRVLEKHRVFGRVHLVELDKMPAREALALEKEFTALSGRKWVPSLFFNGAFWGNEARLAQLEATDGTAAALAKAGLA